MKKSINLILVICVSVLITSCLTTEYKEYRFVINSDGSGSGSVKFINIVSQEDDSEDVSLKDFQELIDNHIEGTSFESENPQYNVTSKELFEENGVLCGEVKFTFPNADSLKFIRIKGCNCAPVLYHMGYLSETFVESNGQYLGRSGNDLPVISWDTKTKELYFKTVVQSDMESCHSLLSLYNAWKEDKK